MEMLFDTIWTLILIPIFSSLFVFDLIERKYFA